MRIVFPDGAGCVQHFLGPGALALAGRGLPGAVRGRHPQECPFALLAAIAETPEEDLRHAFTHLQAVEFVYETSLFPDLEYTIKHALTHEVAYGTLLHDRRHALHAQVVEAIERVYAGRLTECVDADGAAGRRS